MKNHFTESKKVLYDFIDRANQDRWPDDLRDYARAAVRRWLGEEYAPLDEITVLAQSMGLTNEQQAEFIDLVLNQVSHQTQDLGAACVYHDESPVSQAFILTNYARNFPRISREEAAAEVEAFQAGESARARLYKGDCCLSSAEKHKLESLVSRGRDAQERLLMGNWRLVLNYARKNSNMGVSEEDLVQEGILGLIKAMQSFVPGKAAFSTYAMYWIKKFICEAISNQGRQIPLHPGTSYAWIKIQRASANFETQNGQAPTVEALSLDTGFTVRKIRNVIRSEQLSRSVSLDSIGLNEDNALSLSETIPDPNAEEAFDRVTEQEQIGSIEEILHRVLTPKEELVILARFGFNNQKPKTLLELGSELGCTKEYVRLIEKKALAKLKIIWEPQV